MSSTKAILSRLMPPLMALTAACTPAPDPETLIDSALRSYRSGDYASALLTATEALDATGDDSILTADVYILLADCHRAAGNVSGQLASAEAAISAAPSYLPSKRALIDAASSSGQYRRALTLLASMPDADTDPDGWNRMQLVDPALKSGQRDMAMRALLSLHADSMWLSPERLALLAETYPDRADEFFANIDPDKLKSPDDIAAVASYYAGRDPARAIRLYRRMNTVRDSLAASMVSARFFQQLYDNEHSRRIEHAHRSTLLGYGIILSLAVIAAIVATMLYHKSAYRRKLLEAENRLLMADRELHELATRSKDTIGRLFRESYNDTELAANLLIDSSTSAKGGDSLIRHLSARVDSCRSPGFMARLEETVNSCHSDAMVRFRRDIPTVSDNDIAIALYCAAGLSPRVICLLLNCSPAALYNKKYRLKRKIQTSAATDDAKAEYLKIIG